MNTNLHEAATRAALWRRSPERVASFPPVAVVLGSRGWGSFVDGLSDVEVIPYGQIPHFPRTTVAGHQGNLVVGRIGDAPIAALQGRFHYYEGHDLAAVTFPIRVLKLLGVGP